jgi:ABC-2 type transport system permease protein
MARAARQDHRPEQLLIAFFRQLLERRELILTLVKRDLKVRYKASTLGFLWSFGRPLFLMLIMWTVFTIIVPIKADIPYGLHLLTGILAWMFFTGAIFESQTSVLMNANVVKKVALPRAVFPTAAVLGNLVHLLLAFSVLAVFIVGYATILGTGILPGWEIVLLPLVVLLQCALLLGLGLILSSLFVYYRDVGSISEIFLAAWFYLTPIIYPMQVVRHRLKPLAYGEQLYYLYLCNPMTPIVVAYRRVLYGQYLRHAPEVADRTLLLGLTITAVWAAGLLLYGSWLFQRLSRRFADEL